MGEGRGGEDMSTKIAQFTPGPWFANQSEMEAHSCKVEIRTTNGAYLICSDAGYQNAPLIAAAPTMYEALKMARWLSNECECHESWNAPEGNLCGHCTADLAIKTALSQAEGKQL